MGERVTTFNKTFHTAKNSSPVQRPGHSYRFRIILILRCHLLLHYVCIGCFFSKEFYHWNIVLLQSEVAIFC